MSFIQTKSINSNLLAKAYNLKTVAKEDLHDSFESFKNSFERMEESMMMLVNHTSYNNVAKCVIRIEHDINNEHYYNLKIDIDELIFSLEEIINNEKSYLSNIF